MAVIWVNPKSYIDLGEVDFEKLGDWDLSTSSKKIVFSLGPDSAFKFSGTAFRFDSDGFPVAGKLRGMTVIEGGETLTTFSGLNVPIVEFVEAVLTDDVDADWAFVAKMLRKNDTFDGGGGKDDFFGFAGKDKLNGNGGADYLVGGDGNDTIEGSVGGDFLFGDAGRDKIKGTGGDAGKDRIKGGSGDDIIVGGKHADTLTGNGGADVFLFASPKDSTVKAKGRDVVTDFEAGSDRIDLSEIGSGLAFVGGAAFSGTAGEVRFKTKGKDTYVYADVDGDAGADLAVRLKGKIELSDEDFIL